MTTLVVDVGNARIKWARAANGVIGSTGHALHGGAPALAAQALAGALPERVERIIVANVAGDAIAAALAECVRSRADARVSTASRPTPANASRPSPAEIEFVTTAAELLGVRCGYHDPSRLGVDRWVAVIAAHHTAAPPGSAARPACVINAGTALTFDAVDAAGNHLGGLIVAGPRIAAAALERHTRRIGPTSPAAGRPAGLRLLGRSTDEAVGHAALLAPAAAFDRAVEVVARELGVQPAVYLAGGDAALLEPWLETPVQLKADFVLEGLALIAAASTPHAGRTAAR